MKRTLRTWIILCGISLLVFGMTVTAFAKETSKQNDAVQGNSIKISAETPQIKFNPKPLLGIYLNKSSLPILGVRLSKMGEKKLKTDVDLEKTTLKPGEIRKDLVFTYKKAELRIAAINPYENDAPLSECIACHVSTEDTTGVFSMDSNYEICGKAGYEDLKYSGIYQDTGDRLIYKTWILIPVDMTFSLEADPKGKKIIEPRGEAELILDFENGILKRFTYLLPEIYYQGMEDNIDENTIDTLDVSAIDAVQETRDNILTDLQKAFAAAKVEVDINEQTGEIVMKNDILFAKDSYDLSDEGKDYIDRFMGAYASVVFSEKYVDSIGEIRFEGHTDSSGEYDYNLTLSENRARAILEQCLKSKKNGITDDQKNTLKKVATTVGYANSDLVYDDSGKEDPDKSRRAAIKFFVKVK